MFLSSYGFAQDSSRMETDRPDQTESPYITKRRYIQVELGLNRHQENGLIRFVHPTALWKYGALKRFEFRLITELNSQETSMVIPEGNNYKTGLAPIRIGSKIAFWEEKGLLPKTSLITHFAFPKWASKFYQANKVAPEFRLTMQNTISKNTSLGYNFGAIWDGFSNKHRWFYTVAPGFNLGKRGYMYIEWFGDFQNGTNPNHNFDGGLAWYFTDDTKLDISSGFNLKDSKQYYVALGFSFRFKAF
jgi:hypothetical protein